jgi:putative flavoprotein involved in K+ transport
MNQQREAQDHGPRPAAGAEQVETVIIGGSQAGLATGYHLARHGLEFLILDANERIGDAWRNRWDSLRLFTPARYSGLPGWPFPGPAWSIPTKDDVADYLQTYAARFELPVRTDLHVDKLSSSGGRYLVTAGGRRIEADHVVVATGAYHTPRVPGFAGELDPGIVQLHSSQYRNPSQLREGGLLVVGAGNSGAEIALEASATHRTWLSGRHPGSEPARPGSSLDRLVTPVMWLLATRVLTVGTPMGQAVRRKYMSAGIPVARVRPTDTAAAGIERVARTSGVSGGLPVLEDGRIMDVTNVIWCTGFRSDFGWIDLPVLDEDGEPVHDRGIAEAQPGLYFMGLFFLSALASILIGGVGTDAERIAGHIAAHRADHRLTRETASTRRP